MEMARRSLWTVFALLLVGVLFGAAAPPAASRTLAAAPSPSPVGDPPLAPGPNVVEDPFQRIQPEVLQGLNTTGRAGYIVVLTEQADTSNTLTGWAAKGQFVYNRLRATATAAQAPILSYLEAQQAAGHVDSYQPLWIINAIVVNSDAGVLDYFAHLPAVSVVWANGTVRALGHPANTGSLLTEVLHPERNISAVRAPAVWALGNRGQGVVIANLDTGVAATHPALARKYRGWNNGQPLHDYNWWDAINGEQSAGPYDDQGHGTHTMGIIVGSEADGSNAIGVAPAAQWIAVKMLDSAGQGTDATALTAMQWVLAPTRGDGSAPRPDLRPQVVSNAWGAVCASAVSRGAVKAWQNAGIFASFASGDDGALAAPAAFPEAFAVGAVDDRSGQAPAFSGRGASCYDGSLRPQILAPGVEIRSSVPPAAYQNNWSGSSMAQAHVAGVAALLIAARPDLPVSTIRNVLTTTAQYNSYMGTRPNVDYGWGVVDARAAYGAIQPPTPTPSASPVPPTAAPGTATATPTGGCQPGFRDVPATHWAAAYIQRLYCRGYVNGYPDGRFRPETYTTRAQFTKMLVLSRHWPLLDPVTPTFTDVPRDYWSYSYIETAYAHDVLNGYADGTFRPQDNVTRGQLAKMLVQSQNWPLAHPAQATFSDVGSGHWAYEWIETVAAHGIATGYADHTFRPTNFATRAQLSKTLFLTLTTP
jgi:subtilisin family serine protease